jgi:hypothetical protein
MENTTQLFRVNDIVIVKKNREICQIEEIYGKLVRIRVLNSRLNKIKILSKTKIELLNT